MRLGGGSGGGGKQTAGGGGGPGGLGAGAGAAVDVGGSGGGVEAHAFQVIRQVLWPWLHRGGRERKGERERLGATKRH